MGHTIADDPMSLLASLLRRRDGRRPPEWDGGGPGDRVLVEHPDAEVREVVAQRLGEHGYRVLTCAGPDGAERDVPRCPLYEGRSCPGIHGADVVVVALDLDAPPTREHVARVVATVPDRPVIVDSALRVASTTLDRPHRLYRTTIAPLVRQLHERLEDSRPRSGSDARQPPA